MLSPHSLFPLLALWGNKNWLPSMKVKNLENHKNKLGSTGYKWSSLNGPGIENPISHAILEFPFIVIALQEKDAVFAADGRASGRGGFIRTQVDCISHLVNCGY